MTLLLYISFLILLESSHLFVCSCIPTVTPEEPEIIVMPVIMRRVASQITATSSRIITSTPTTTPTTSITTTMSPNNTDCNSSCPSIYSDDCNGSMPTICATSTQAAAMVTDTGVDCRLTWTCPNGTSPHYYTGANSTAMAYFGDYAQCFMPPNNNWYLFNGTTEITAIACQTSPAIVIVVIQVPN